MYDMTVNHWRNYYLGVQGGKPDQHSSLSLSPLSTRLTQNNEKRVVENGRLEPEHKMVTGKTEGDANNYLHKKFKKVATLEETSPAKVRCEKEDEGLSSGARYPCPYCKQAFGKPSVLQKHIRAHTNERPYPCHPCGFAFKTKSNLYKHCRSRAHTLKMDPSEGGSSEEEEAEARLEVRRPYKPKFHTAAIYTEEEGRIPASPSPDYLQRRISRLISENQAIVDEVSWPMKPRHRDTPPASPVLKNGDSDAAHSRLALALLRPQRAGTPELGEPLNLTVKEPRKRSISESRTDSFIKDILLKAHSAGSLGEREERTLLCPHCKASFKSSDNLEIHLYCCQEKQNEKILMSPGPLLGNTPLVELQKDEPNLKRRKLDLHLQEAMNSPGKSVHLFGGEVLINDKGGKTKTLRIESSKKEYVDCSEKKTEEEQQVVMISKTGLHCAGGTMIQTGAPSCRSPSGDRLVLPIKPSVLTPTLSVPGLSAPVQVPLPLNPLTSITAFNPLTLPTPNTGGGGLLTILHGGRPIPYVPGMPGPNTLLSQPPLLPKKCDKPPSVIVKTSKTDLPPPPPPPPPKVDEEKKDVDEMKSSPPAIPPSCSDPPTTTTGEKKFARPSSLPLKPGTYTPKRHPTTPHLTLVSPETPRPRKSYGQLYLNGHAYTYLGLKCSTRTFFCTLNKTQPTYVSLFPDQYKVSMYSNWTICSDSNPHPLGLETRKAMGLYDSRNKTGIYTVANRNKNDIITHSSYHSSPGTGTSSRSGDTSPRPEKSCLTTEIGQKRVKVCEGGFESNEEYTYVRGRGKGRYVCEECGIRCKKPSMLKKHIQTHTDLRPYTCKHCVFSFKTKGNLTKHMKSKAHFKKCIELGIFPVPSSVDDSIEDDNELKVDDDYSHGSESDEESDEDDEEEDDEDDEDDEFSDDEGEDCKTRRDVARSLLTLSEVTLETAHRQYVNAGLVPTNSRPRTFPYTLVSTQVVEPNVEKVSPAEDEGSCWMGSPEPISLDTNDSSMSTEDSIDLAPPEPYTPIDLSNKTLPGGSVQTAVITSVGGQMSLLKSLCTTTDKTEAGAGQTGGCSSAEDSTLLHTYLTERAVRESHLKEKQREEPGCLETAAGAKAKESALGVLALSLQSGRPPSPRKAEFIPAQSGPSPSFISSTEDGRSMCGVCNKVFNKPSQLRLHVNIHYFERPFRCDACAVSFRSKGHLQKHQRSLSHLNKVNMNSTFGTATSSNPRPFKCDDCKIAFRIHGHLAKHLRSKMHIMKLECLGKLPFGTYAELERSGTNMNDIDTTDCDNSLESLQILAKKLCENDPSKLSTWAEPGLGDSSSEEDPDPSCYKTDTSSSSINQNMCQPRYEAAHRRSSLSTEQDDGLSLSLRYVL